MVAMIDFCHLQGIAARNIHMKAFGTVPMADCEMLFPDKSVYVKPIVMIQLIITLVIGLVTAFLMLMSVRSVRDMRVKELGLQNRLQRY